MSDEPLVRWQYWNLSTTPNPTPRTEMTPMVASRTDIESFLINSADRRSEAFVSSGVAAGLQVLAAIGASEVTVSAGSAVDALGRLIVLATGGRAVTASSLGSDVQNIPTVEVGGVGVPLDTTGQSGRRVVTVTWLEVQLVDSGELVVGQAPWVRLADPAFTDDGIDIPLATVVLDAAGTVTALEAAPRRVAGAVASRLDLQMIDGGAGGTPVGQRASARLTAGPDGGVQLDLLPATGAARRALSVSAAQDVTLAAGLTVTGATTLGSTLTVTGKADARSDLTVAGTLTAGHDLAVAGNVVVGAGSDARLITRHVTGKRSGTDDDDPLFLNWNTGQPVHVGGDQRVGGGQPANLQVNGHLGVGTAPDPNFDIRAADKICAVTFCNPSDLRLKSDLEPLRDVLDRLAQVRSVTYALRAGEASDRHAGVVAQDVAGVFPELVVPMGEDGMMAVDYSGLAGVLVGAVNELAERVRQLEGAGHDRR